MDREQVELLRGFFGQGKPGAAYRLNNFVVPTGLTIQSLAEHGEIARRYIEAGKDQLGVQELRLELIGRAMREFERGTK